MHEYKNFCVMLDVSRNGVMKVEKVKEFIVYLEKMRYTGLELYMEDVMDIDQEGFGYQRGRYTCADIRELDRFAAEHHIELIPCVQTLAHFTCFARMPQAQKFIARGVTLRIGDEPTYAFIEKIIRFCAENYTTKKINIGMDEAALPGQTYEERLAAFSRHLDRVYAICKKYGLKPHMWSDMFFTVNGWHTGMDRHVPQKTIDAMPEDIELVYWDYYNKDTELYDSMIRSHKETGKELWFAGTAWNSRGIAPLNFYSLLTMKPAMASVVKNQVENVMMTIWGEDGRECPPFSTLPVLYAARRYADGVTDEQIIAEEFRQLFGISFDDFMFADAPNLTKDVLENNTFACVGKVFLYSDLFYGVFDDYAEEDLGVDYDAYACRLASIARQSDTFGYIFDTLSKLCRVLDKKVYMGVNIRRAYRAKDKAALSRLCADCDELILRVEDLIQSFRTLWFTDNLPSGWEIHDARLGGLIQRIKTCKLRLNSYISGDVDTIEELDEPVIHYADKVDMRYLDLISRNCLR